MSEQPLEGRALEQALCVICNGKGISPGENPMCIEHYQSEVIDKKNDEEHPMSIRIVWDDEIGHFQIKFMEGESAIFTVQMNPKSFEKLSNDMIKTIKNYNLMQAQQYQESLKNGEKEKSECNVNEEGVSDPACADCIREDERKQSESDNG